MAAKTETSDALMVINVPPISLHVIHITLTDFWLNCFIIMASKSRFFWKTWNCGYLHPKKNTFLMAILLKLTLDNILIKVKKSTRAVPPSQNSWTIFQMQISLLLWRPQRPQRPQGCLKKQNHPLSSNLVVWCAKIGPKTQDLWKIVENP